MKNGYCEVCPQGDENVEQLKIQSASPPALTKANLIS